MLRIAERTKRAENEERVERMGGTFTPLACSVYGTLGPESEQVLQVLTTKMKEKTEDPADAAARVRRIVQMAIIKATSLCIRTRSQTNPYGAEVNAQRTEAERLMDETDSQVEEEEEEEEPDVACVFGDLRYDCSL